MTLKETLEEIWNTPGCLCPSHRVHWFLKLPFYRRRPKWILGMAYGKGRRMGSVSKSRKRGHSYLCKNYQLAWRWKDKL